MLKYKIIIDLITDTTITIEKEWFMEDTLIKNLNDGNSNILIDNYIIPKSSIKYIKIEKIEE